MLNGGGDFAVGKSGGEARARSKIGGSAEQLAVGEGKRIAALQLVFGREGFEALTEEFLSVMLALELACESGRLAVADAFQTVPLPLGDEDEGVCRAAGVGRCSGGYDG